MTKRIPASDYLPKQSTDNGPLFSKTSKPTKREEIQFMPDSFFCKAAEKACKKHYSNNPVELAECMRRWGCVLAEKKAK